MTLIYFTHKANEGQVNPSRGHYWQVKIVPYKILYLWNHDQQTKNILNTNDLSLKKYIPRNRKFNQTKYYWGDISD